LDACKIGLQVVVLSDAIGNIGLSADSLLEIDKTGSLQATASDLGI
jgi:hypothetical protein